MFYTITNHIMLKRLLISFLSLGALLSFSAEARVPGRPSAMPVGLNAVAPAKIAPAAVVTPAAVENPGEVTDWVSRGTVKFKESYGIIGQCISYDFGFIDVEIEESESNPGLYRVVNPYSGYVGKGLYEDDIDTSKDYYMIVDATDPENVSIPEFETGVVDYYNDNKMILGKSFSSGTVEDYVVTFPEWGIGYGYEGESWNSGNWHGTFQLSLPGATDYLLTFDYGDINPDDNVGRYTVTAGKDVASVKYILSNSILTERQLKAKVQSEGIELDLSAGSYTVNLDKSGYYQLYMAAFDAEGTVRSDAGVTFYRFDEDADNWQSLGTTTITENFVGSYWNIGSSTYGVEIQKHAATEGLYRIVNPYIPVSGEANHPYSTLLTSKPHYIYIDASDPDAAFFYESPLGVNEYYGEVVVTSYAYYAMSHYGYSKQQCQQSGYFGSFKNGVVTFPDRTTLLWIDKHMDNMVNITGEFLIPIPNEHTVSVASSNDELGSVAITDPATEGNTVTTLESRVTLKATPAEGCGFIEWRDALGKVVSTDAEYTYFGTVDAAFTAVFGYNVNLTVNGEGSAELTDAGGSIVAPGTTLLPGSALTLTVRPTDANSILDIDINGVRYSSAVVEFTVDQPTDITVNILDKLFRLIVNVTGQGDVQVFTRGSDSEAPVAENVLFADEDMPKSSSVRVFAAPAAGMKIVSASFIPGNGSQTPTVLSESRFAKCSWDEDWYYLRGTSGHQNKSDYVINVEFGPGSSAIDSVAADDAEAVYFNLQGLQVAPENLTTGFYILRQADKSTKVYIVR